MVSDAMTPNVSAEGILLSSGSNSSMFYGALYFNLFHIMIH